MKRREMGRQSRRDKVRGRCKGKEERKIEWNEGCGREGGGRRETKECAGDAKEREGEIRDEGSA